MTTKVRKGKCCNEKEKTRKEFVAAALASAYFQSDQEKREAIEIYNKADLTIEEILILTAGLRDMTRNATKTKSKVFGSTSRVMGIGGIA